ncbi:cholesterol 25-hydroxylase-like protein [Menidia menidia]
MLLQPLWDLLLSYSPLLCSPFFPLLFSLGGYLILCVPYLLLEALAGFWPPLARRRLQPLAPPPWPRLPACLARTAYNHLLFILPLSLLHGHLSPVRLPPHAPPLDQVLVQVLVLLLLFDFQSFVWHFLHHKVPWLYQTFHKVHHTYSAPSCLTAEFSGVWESLSLGLFASAPPLLLGAHPLTQMCFHLLTLWLSVEAHCGFDLPGAPHRLLPGGLFGGAPHHDLHHRRPKVNYAPYFTHWDRLFGTLQRPGP